MHIVLLCRYGCLAISATAIAAAAKTCAAGKIPYEGKEPPGSKAGRIGNV
jgi:hypothetical protein